ncbi:MAG: molybdopterin oxidoreductase, partial [Acidimicrobiia bacterium]|nr:molybdopterin oxidoreductase [Acidimicrobiia bacterium]
RPGTDYGLLAYVIRELLADPAFDRASLAERADGIDELADLVQPFDRARVTALTGLDGQSIDDFVGAIRRAGRVAIVTGTGTSMARRAYLTEWMAWALMIITDSFDQPGGMWFNPGYYYRLDQRGPMKPVIVNPPGLPSHPDILPIRGEWPSTLIPEEIEAGRLKALIVVGADPATSLPDTIRLTKAFAELEVFLAFDTAPTETTRQATHVFACADQLERPDLPGLDLFGTGLSTRWTDAVVAAKPEAPEMWRLFAKLAERMGHSVLKPGEEVDTMLTETMFERTRRGVNVQRVRDAGGYLLDAPAVYNWVQSRLPYGKWRLAPERLIPTMADAPNPPALQLSPRRQGRRLNSLEFRAGDRPEALMNPIDAPDGVADGDLVEVSSAVGSLRLHAKLSEFAAVGTVSIPHGWVDANVNLLIDSEDIDPLTGMPMMCGTAVTVRRSEVRDDPAVPVPG